MGDNSCSIRIFDACFVDSLPSRMSAQFVFFHSSPRREDETASAPVKSSKGGLFGTGVSEWYALPVGMVAAIPALHFDWYVINEETQLAAAFVAFCVIVYTQGGDAIHRFLDERAQSLLKEHRESEEGLLDEMAKLIDHLGNQLEIPEVMRNMNGLRADAFAKLSAAGAVKPGHDLKIQVERMLHMIAQEEASNREKMKMSLMSEATETVTEQFSTSKSLKKSALDGAIGFLKRDVGGANPVKSSFLKFFKDKCSAAERVKDDSADRAQRNAFIMKANAVAQSEGYFFRFDDKGIPKMAT